MNALDVEAIRKETQAIEDQLFHKPGETPPVTPSPIPPVVPVEPVVPPVTPPVELPVSPIEPPTPPVEPITPPVTPPVEPSPVEPPVSDWEHKYKVLQGKYNKELREERQRTKEASDRIATFQYENSQLQSQLRDVSSRLERLEKGEKPPADTTVSLSYDPEKDPDGEYLRTQFPDAWKAFKGLITKSINAAVTEVRKEIGQVDKTVKDQAIQSKHTAKMSFEKYLDDNVEGWRSVDTDPKFAQWLQRPAPYTNIPMINLINKASQEFDAVTVSRFFIDFALENSAPVVPVPPATPAPIKPVIPPGPVTPPRGPNPPPPRRPPTQETITTSDIAKFYDDRLHGKYRGKEAEMMAEEKRIEKAVAEGRVVQG